jgi:hypothetical protein
MREKEGKGPRGPDHPQPEFLENGVAKGGVVRGLSGARTRDEGPEGRRAGARVDMQRLSGKRDMAWRGRWRIGVPGIGHSGALPCRVPTVQFDEPA